MHLQLKKLRLARQLTLKQVGTYLGKSYATISRYEHGRTPISSTDMLKLATWYGMDVRDLWQDHEDHEADAV
jgi:transcriptional regulator with XRE-family HTH domain